MNSFLRAVSLILLVTLILSVGLGLLLTAGLLPEGSWSWVLAVTAVLLFFTLPTTAGTLWVASRVRQAQHLADGARASLASGDSSPIPAAAYDGFVGQLARLFEEWRLIVVEQRRRILALERMSGRILDGIGEGVLAIDRDKNVVFANRKLLDLIGSLSPMAGAPFYQLIRQATVHSALDRALAGHPSSEIVSIPTGESERQVNVHVFPLEEESEVAAVAIFIDVTRVEHLERIRRDFLSDFSHEVRTPLAGLRSAVETLEGGGLQAGEQELLWGIATRQLTRLERLVHDLSELNRIESGDLELVRRRVDLNGLLRDSAKDFADRAASRRVTLSVSPGEVVEAVVDPQRVQQIVANLIDNAIKFSPCGAEVTLRVLGTERLAHIEVTDRGEGIPAADQRRIFNRFYRVDRSRSQEVPGTGLGLAITKHLAALQGGSIEVESEPGVGSTFRVKLPRG